MAIMKTAAAIVFPGILIGMLAAGLLAISVVERPVSASVSACSSSSGDVSGTAASGPEANTMFRPQTCAASAGAGCGACASAN
jgi:hypothetical protein